MSELRVTMSDVRACLMCSQGARKFFERHGLDWTDFVKNGIPAEVLEATGDAMALKVVEVVRGRQQLGTD